MAKTLPFPLFFALFTRPFYTFFKRIYEQCTLPVAVRRLHIFECFVLLIILLFLASLALQLSLGFQLFWDPFVSYIAVQGHLYDRYLLACAVCFIFYCLTLNVQLFLDKKSVRNASNRSLSWQSVAYDLIVRNVDQAQKCGRLPKRTNFNPNQINNRLFAYLSLLYNQIHDDLTQKHLDLGKLVQPRHRLKIFNFLSVKTRQKCLQFQCFCNLYNKAVPINNSIINLIVPLLGLTLQMVLVVATTEGMPPLGWLLLLTDFTLIWIFAYLFYRNVLLLVYFLMIISLAIRCHLQTAHRLLTYLMAKGRSRPFQGLNTWNRLLLRNFVAEHAQICALLDASNRQFISVALFATLLLNAPTNIYLVYRLIYRPIILIEFTAILVLSYAQISSLACVVLPLVMSNSALYRTGKYLPGVQLYVLRGGSNRSLKIKYEILQSTLTESRVKSGASFGPLCLITSESLYKVVSLYAAYMLVFFDLLPK